MFVNKDNALLMLVALLIGLLAFFVNIGSVGPMIQADEGSYLANAAAIAGYRNDMASSYHAGYSLILAPLFKLGLEPSQIWVGVKVVNTALLILTVLMLGLLAKALYPEASFGDRLLGVVLTSLYPMWVVMVGYAFAQIAFVPFYLIVVYFFYRGVVSSAYLWWLLLGFAAAYVYWIHPMGMPVILAVFLASLYWARVSGRYGGAFLSIFGIVVGVIVYKALFLPWLYDKMTISELPPHLHYPDASLVLSRLLHRFSSVDGALRHASILGGHVFYLILGTLGLVVVGIWSLISWFISGFGSPQLQKVKAAIALLLLGGLLGALALSVLAMFGAERLDHWIYGRYVEGVLAPILLVGAMTRSWRQGILWAVPIAFASAALLSIGLGSYKHTAPFNVSTFWQEFFIRECGLWVWLLVGISIVVLVQLLPKKIALLGVIAFFVFNITLHIQYHAQNSKGAARRALAAEQIRQLYKPGTCIGFDLDGFSSYEKSVFWFDYGFKLYDYHLMRLDYDRWLASCDGPFFSYDRSLLDDARVVPIVSSPHGGPTLFAKAASFPIKQSDIYPINVNYFQPHLLKILSNGWYEVEATHVWSTKEAILKLPVPARCQKVSCEFRLFFNVYGASKQRPVTVHFGRLVDRLVQPIQSLNVVSSELLQFNFPAQSRSTEVLVISVPDAISPQALSGGKDARVLGIALRTIEVNESSL